MNIGELEMRVRVLAGDPNSTIYSEQQLVDWINDGIKECIIQNSLCQKTATQNLVVGTSSYTLPTDIFKLHSVNMDGEKIDIMSLQEWEQDNAGYGNSAATPVGNGRPAQAYTWAGSLVFSPPPDMTYSLRINYIYEPPALTIGNAALAIPIPDTYHMRLVTYCLAQIAFQDDDIQKYQNLMGQFTTGVIDLRHQMNNEEDLYPFISVSSRDAGDY